jgi:hypothetical protein
MLEINGREVIAESEELYQVAISVEAREMSQGELGEWFADYKNVLPLNEEELIEAVEQQGLADFFGLDPDF